MTAQRSFDPAPTSALETPADRAIHVLVNGQPHAIQRGGSVHDLLLVLGLDPAQVAVERNGEIVPRRTRPEVTLAENDRIELVTFVGGG
ncbi:MAG: sulfur carrier protein ThiS [Myxococcales bacterium]|nr:sulfur carrier protein ThiS [Myxococcales bacterium]